MRDLHQVLGFQFRKPSFLAAFRSKRAQAVSGLSLTEVIVAATVLLVRLVVFRGLNRIVPLFLTMGLGCVVSAAGSAGNDRPSALAVRWPAQASGPRAPRTPGCARIRENRPECRDGRQGVRYKLQPARFDVFTKAYSVII